jgi:hypothetical protein
MNVKRSVVAIAVCLCGAGLLLATYKASTSTTPNGTLNPRWTADGEPPPPPKPPYLTSASRTWATSLMPSLCD